MHVTERNRAPEGYAAALRMAAGFEPDFLVTGGDHVGDALEIADRAAVERQWDVHDRVLAEHNALPVRPVVGNHDVWGWMVPTLDPLTPGYGKAMALDRLRLASPYYSFDHGGWHFVVLDNVQKVNHSYLGALDPEQHASLVADLAANDKPVCLFSHIPILTVCAFRPPGHMKDTYYWVPDTWMHANAVPLIHLLAKFGVKLCISGHLHMVDRVDFLGVTFICNGSVCGRWWNGPYEEFAEGFGVFDLFNDGTFEHRYVPMGWQAEKR